MASGRTDLKLPFHMVVLPLVLGISPTGWGAAGPERS